MTVPQSVLVVALVAMWLVVLVPSSSRRRRQVKQVVDGVGLPGRSAAGGPDPTQGPPHHAAAHSRWE